MVDPTQQMGGGAPGGAPGGPGAGGGAPGGAPGGGPDPMVMLALQKLARRKRHPGRSKSKRRK